MLSEFLDWSCLACRAVLGRVERGNRPGLGPSSTATSRLLVIVPSAVSEVAEVAIPWEGGVAVTCRCSEVRIWRARR